MKLIIVVGIIGLFFSCAHKITIQDSNYNLNQAKKIIKYTSTHTKLRQRISDHNRDIQNENHIRLNATNKHPDTRHQNGIFKFYRNN